MKNKIKPYLPSGFKDYLPTEAFLREEILKKIKNKLEIFGFLPLETPAVEEEKLLTGGDKNFKKELLKIERKGGEKKEKLALRFDLTVPLARVITLYPQEIKIPFKRYAIGKVWRGEKPQSGRYREFLQCDADIIGTDDILADAEIVSLIYELTSDLGFKNFLIKINNRKVLNFLPFYLDFPNKYLERVLIIIDKIDKIGFEGIASQLLELPYFSKQKVDKLIRLLKMKAKNSEEYIGLLKKEFLILKRKEVKEEAKEKVFEELRLMANYLDFFKVPQKNWIFDIATVRGLSYYTGFVFETVLTDLPEVGSIFSGGRYDNLVENLGGNRLPAVGASLGFDRAFYAMEKLGIIDLNLIKRKPAVMIIYLGEKTLKKAIQVLNLLRKNNVITNIYLGKEKSIKNQITYALKNNYKAAIILGEDELKKKKAKIKFFEKFIEKEIDFAKIHQVVKKEFKI